MQTHPGAGLVGRLSRWLPARRWQTAHWLGKLFVPSRPFVGRFHTGLLEVHPGEIASSGAFFLGFYEREVTMWCQHLMQRRPPELVIDVGANFGYYPLLFGLLSGGKTESIAFEPDPGNFAWLSRNLSLNPGLRTSPVAQVVGDVDGELVPFRTANEGQNLWAHVVRSDEDECAPSVVNVPSTTLDAYLDRVGVGEVPLTMIDVEGYEARVIRGMAGGIAKRVYKTVVVEFHASTFPNPDAAIQSIVTEFLNAGYQGRRFRQYTGSRHHDKDRNYYRLAEIGSLLGPLTFDQLTSWEHYLFTVNEELLPAPSDCIPRC